MIYVHTEIFSVSQGPVSLFASSIATDTHQTTYSCSCSICLWCASLHHIRFKR